MDVQTATEDTASFDDEIAAEVRATKKMKGRRTKIKAKAPTRLERAEKLRTRLLHLKEELENMGFGGLLKPPGPIQLVEEPDLDPKTGGYVGKVREPLAAYIQRVSIADNFSQRPPFDHVIDPIYRRLIRDYIEGALMPESKVAALNHSNGKVEKIDAGPIRCSIIDGLQRLYCYCIAILLVLYREQLVADGVIPKDAWEYFAEVVKATGDPKAATEKILTRLMRYEVFYNIDLGGLLHFMVTFNTGQRRMNLPVQLEIMKRPLIEELQIRAQIKLWYEIEKIPGMTKPKEQFAASDLILATEAFIANNAQVSAAPEADRYLEDEAYLYKVGDIEDVVATLKRIATDLHPAMMAAYASDPYKRYLLSTSSAFLFGLVAACGYIRNTKNMKVLDGELDRLMNLMKEGGEDPLNLADYWSALEQITASRGKATRRLVDDTFRRFFNGATSGLDWLDTAKSIGGGA